MSTNEFPIINGNATSWADLDLIFSAYDGPQFRTSDFTALAFKETLDPGEQRGAGPAVRGSSVGQYSVDGPSFTMAYQAHLRFMRVLVQVARSKGIPLGAVNFEIAGAFKTPGQDLSTFELIGCRVIERGLDTKPGPDVIEIETPLWCPLARIDGVSLYEVPR